jgi:hypothetical protein
MNTDLIALIEEVRSSLVVIKLLLPKTDYLQEKLIYSEDRKLAIKNYNEFINLLRTKKFSSAETTTISSEVEKLTETINEFLTEISDQEEIKQLNQFLQKEQEDILKLAALTMFFEKGVVQHQSALSDQYAFRTIPLIDVQEVIAKNQQAYDPNAGLVTVDYDTKEIESSGLPSLEKFNKIEAENHRLKTEISIYNTAVNIFDSIDYPDDLNYPELSLELIKQSFGDLVREIYVFMYKQLNENKLPLVEVVRNASMVFPKQLDRLEKLIDSRIKEVLVLQSKSFFAEDKLMKDKSELLNRLQELVDEDVQLIDFGQLSIYEVVGRVLSKFEQENFDGFFAVDISLVNKNEFSGNLRSMLLSYSPLVYRLAVERIY